MEKNVGEFAVRSDAGDEFLVGEFAKIIPAGDMHNPHAMILSRLKSLRTAEGYAVTPQADGTFMILDLNLVVNRVS